MPTILFDVTFNAYQFSRLFLSHSRKAGLGTS